MQAELEAAGLRCVRLQGNDRYATSIDIGKSIDNADARKLFLVSGENFPDALAIGPVASNQRTPVLLGINAGEDEQPDDSSLDKPEDNPPVNDESTTPADEGDGKTDAKGDADEGGEDIAATQSTVSTEINPAAAENSTATANNITEGNTEQYE